jgi:hypothetical protein
MMHATIPLATGFRQQIIDKPHEEPPAALWDWPAPIQSQTTDASRESGGGQGQVELIPEAEGNDNQPAEYDSDSAGSSSRGDSEAYNGDESTGTGLRRKAVKALPAPHPYYKCLDYVRSTPPVDSTDLSGALAPWTYSDMPSRADTTDVDANAQAASSMQL